MKATDRPIELGPRRRKRFPWILLLLLLASVYAFWILPYYQLGTGKPVKVEFSGAPE